MSTPLDSGTAEGSSAQCACVEALQGRKGPCGPHLRSGGDFERGAMLSKLVGPRYVQLLQTW